MTQSKLIGHQLSLSPTEADSLWTYGNGFDGTDTARRSENGLWVLRHFDGGFTTTQRATEQRDRIEIELEKYRAFGGLIISYGIVVHEQKNALIIVSPWIDRITSVPPSVYWESIFPTLLDYYEGKGFLEKDPSLPSGVTYLSDIEDQSQYSVLPEDESRGFLHDTDFFINTTDTTDGQTYAKDIRNNLLEAIRRFTKQ